MLLEPLNRGNTLVGQGDRQAKAAQRSLEKNILCKDRHKLTHDEVENVLRKQNMEKYKKLQFKKRQAVLDSCWSCMTHFNCCRRGIFSRKNEKHHILYKLGIKRMN